MQNFEHVEIQASHLLHICNTASANNCAIDTISSTLWEEQIDSALILRFKLYIDDEEYDTDAIAQDLNDSDVSKCNICRCFPENRNNISLFYAICYSVVSHTSLMECSSIRRISRLLRKFHAYINHQQHSKNQTNYDIYDTVYNTMNVIYKNTDLLNDFNHLMHCHSLQFEDIYNLLSKQIYNNKSCKLSKCLSMRRNNRDRSTCGSWNIVKNIYFTNDN
eukprot:248055_1